MENSKRVEIIRNVLVLATLVGVVLLSWLFGHILRYSIPAFWQPPVQETDPQIKVGLEFEFEGIRRLAVLPGLAPVNGSVQFQFALAPGARPAECLGQTYYTSLPAKCRSVDGRLVMVREFESKFILIPQGK